MCNVCFEIGLYEEFELDTLTQSDLDEYKQQFESKYPPKDMLWYRQLQTMLSKFLKVEDIVQYHQAIWNHDLETVVKFDKKILQRTNDINHVDRRSYHCVPFGVKVRMKSDNECGIIFPSIYEETCSIFNPSTFSILVVDNYELREHVERDEFQILCGNPDCNNDADHLCGKCLQAWYCCTKIVKRQHGPIIKGSVQNLLKHN